MAIYKSLYAKGTKNVPVAQGAEIVSYRATVDLTTFAAGDTLFLGYIPADHQLVDVVLDATDIDAGTAVLLDVGVLTADLLAISTDPANGGGAFITGSTIGQTGGIERASSRAYLDVDSSVTERPVGVVIGGSAADAQAGQVGVTLNLKAAY